MEHIIVLQTDQSQGDLKETRAPTIIILIIIDYRIRCTVKKKKLYIEACKSVFVVLSTNSLTVCHFVLPPPPRPSLLFVHR